MIQSTATEALSWPPTRYVHHTVNMYRLVVEAICGSSLSEHPCGMIEQPISSLQTGLRYGIRRTVLSCSAASMDNSKTRSAIFDGAGGEFRPRTPHPRSPGKKIGRRGHFHDGEYRLACKLLILRYIGNQPRNPNCPNSPPWPDLSSQKQRPAKIEALSADLGPVFPWEQFGTSDLAEFVGA